jgi:preprotein translocase subunit SecY
MPPIIPIRIPLATYIPVIFHPNVPANIATATSFTSGDVIRKAKVTPSGIPPLTNPMNSGIDEQEQKGVIAPNKEASRYSSP